MVYAAETTLEVPQDGPWLDPVVVVLTACLVRTVGLSRGPERRGTGTAQGPGSVAYWTKDSDPYANVKGLKDPYLSLSHTRTTRPKRVSRINLHRRRCTARSPRVRTKDDSAQGTTPSGGKQMGEWTTTCKPTKGRTPLIFTTTTLRTTPAQSKDNPLHPVPRLRPSTPYSR